MGRPKITLSLGERLLAHRRIEPETGCWEWTRSLNAHGYGQIAIDGRLMTVHRCSAVVWLGLDPDSGLWALHRCDNRRCFNPDHLYIGTRADNTRDRNERMRSRGGNQKLCAEQVRAVRRALAAGGTLEGVAAEFGVSDSTISNIRQGYSYRWVA